MKALNYYIVRVDPAVRNATWCAGAQGPYTYYEDAQRELRNIRALNPNLQDVLRIATHEMEVKLI